MASLFPGIVGANGVYIESGAPTHHRGGETPLFHLQVLDVWNEAEREAFIDFIARKPKEGDVIPETGGVRKIRWVRSGSGKRGGTRVIYFYHSDELSTLFG